MTFLVIAAVMVVGGGLLAYIIDNAVEGEYPLIYWLAWAVAVGGLLILIASLRPVRSSYLLLSTSLAILLALTFLMGKTEDEYSPAGWIAMGILASNILIIAAGLALGTLLLALSLTLLGAGLLIIGFGLRRGDYDYYDACYSASGVFLSVALLVGMGLARTPLEHLNEVEIPAFNESLAAAQSTLSSYGGALEQAQQYRTEIDTEFGNNDAAYLAMVDESLTAAAEHHATAETLLADAGEPQALLAAYDASLEQQLAKRRSSAERATAEGRLALNRLSSVQDLFETLSTEWIKEYLWFEVDGFWTSEENDYASYNVCYYGERVSSRANGEVSEMVVSDPADRGEGSFSSDVANRDWKYFTVEDYHDLVNTGLVAPAGQEITTNEAAGYYLCGSSPQSGSYGALGEPPVVIEKEYGSLQREVGDEGASFVGDKRYGTWCVDQGDGQVEPVPENQQPPADARWCWYQKPGDTTGHYWERRYSGGSYIYIRSHRRCLYCTPQSGWRGGALVPDAQMSQINGTEGSSVRGPADQGGGPGTGK